MSKDKKYDPFEGFKQISELWEKQINSLLFMAADNKEFVRITKTGLDAHARYLEMLRKNQDLMAGFMNIPTKKDVANVAKLSIQAEEKIDILEEQIWNLQDSLSSLNKDNLVLFQEMVTIVKQMKGELQKTVEELTEIKRMKDDIQELRHGLVDIKIIQVNLQELRSELEEIKISQKELKGLNRINETKALQENLQEVKQELGQLTDIKEEIATLKELIGKDNPKVKGKEKSKELVTTK